MKENIGNISKNQNILTDEASKRISSLRYILAVSVVVLHVYIPENVIRDYYKIEYDSYPFAEFLKFFIKDFGHAAVPLFFFFSSYFLYLKNDSYAVLIKKRIRTVFIPYVLWISLNILFFLIVQSFPAFRTYFMSEHNLVMKWKFEDYIYAFFPIKDGIPFCGQFWFLFDLMIFFVVSPVLKYLCDKISGVIVLILIVLSVKCIKINDCTKFYHVFFMVLGYLFVKYKVDFFKFIDKINVFFYLILIVLDEVYDFYFLNDSFEFAGVLLKCAFFLRISAYIVNNKSLYNKILCLDVGFFIYAVHHPLFDQSIKRIFLYFKPYDGIFSLIWFLLSALTVVLITTCFAMILRKRFPGIFSVLVGGRTGFTRKKLPKSDKE